MSAARRATLKAFEWTPKREAFCREYLVDLNQAEAARRAGYSARTVREQGYELMQIPEIRARIQALMEKRAERVAVSADYVLGSLIETVERCMQRAPVMVRRGKEMVQLTDEDDNHVWQFDSRGAIGGLNLLGKHLKLFTEVVKHEGLDRLADAMRAAEERLANAR